MHFIVKEVGFSKQKFKIQQKLAKTGKNWHCQEHNVVLSNMKES